MGHNWVCLGVDETQLLQLGHSQIEYHGPPHHHAWYWYDSQFDDLHGVLAMPNQVLSGFALQYSVMPLSGFLISKLLNLPSHSAAGTASNSYNVSCTWKCASFCDNDNCKHPNCHDHDSFSDSQPSWQICSSGCIWLIDFNIASCAFSCVGWCISESVFRTYC
ncbi:sodium/metabolite cotransporter BASS1 [Spatholobus suberectus]|nr:sodium/metabolite cotransporter BASS1 [Spatholobus suberectus]